MANPGTPMYKMEKYNGLGLAAGDLIMQTGQDTFTTTATTKAVSTDLDEIVAAFAVGMTGTPNAADLQLYCAKSVSSSTITVRRPASGESALSFSYLFIGRKTSTS